MSALWKKEYELNIEEIDNQHRGFFEKLESLDELIAKKMLSREEIVGFIRTLLGFRSYGFSSVRLSEAKV